MRQDYMHRFLTKRKSERRHEPKVILTPFDQFEVPLKMHLTSPNYNPFTPEF